MNFDSFLGNTAVKRRISEAVLRARLSHAIVLQGERGSGKRTFAKLMARALVCRAGEAAPCGRCPACVRALAQSHPDIRIEQGSGATHSISVETVRNITLDAYRMPEEASLSIYLIFIENKISEAAQNKFLKLIEEPPENTLFIFTCQNAEMLLPTMRSRVEILTLLPPDPEEAAAHVIQKYDMDPTRAKELAVLCDGNIGRMLEENDDAKLQGVRDLSVALVQNLTKTGGHPLLEVTAPLIKDRRLCADVLARVHLIFRDACVLRSGGKSLLGGAVQEAVGICGLTMKRMIQLPQITQRYRRLLDRNVNMTLLVTSYCAEIRSILEN